MTILITPHCLHRMLEWAGDDAQGIIKDLQERQSDLSAFQLERIAENHSFAVENALSIVDDFDYNRRAALVFFSAAIQERMRQKDVDFATAAQEISDYFEQQDKTTKIEILGARVQRYYPDICAALLPKDEAPEEDRPFGMR